jgi:hypothetical protein
LEITVTRPTEEADPATITTTDNKIKTETETVMQKDKMGTDKAIKTKATATPNADTTHVTKSA